MCEPNLDQICAHHGASRLQLKTEQSRNPEINEDSPSIYGYKSQGCYDCDGQKTSCDGYYVVEKKKRILIVDDSPNILKASIWQIGDLLDEKGEKERYVIDTAVSGDVALDLVKQNGFYTTIISDDEMPVSGFEMYKGLSPAQQRKVIFRTGNSQELREKISKLEDPHFKNPVLIDKSEKNDIEKINETILKYIG